MTALPFLLVVLTILTYSVILLRRDLNELRKDFTLEAKRAEYHRRYTR